MNRLPLWAIIICIRLWWAFILLPLNILYGMIGGVENAMHDLSQLNLLIIKAKADAAKRRAP